LTLSKRCQGPKKLAAPRHRFLLRRGAALILHLALRQLLHFQQFRPRSPKRRYVGGETHLYLGRQYRLKLIKNEPEGVKLKGSFLMVSSQRQKNSIGKEAGLRLVSREGNEPDYRALSRKSRRALFALVASRRRRSCDPCLADGEGRSPLGPTKNSGTLRYPASCLIKMIWMGWAIFTPPQSLVELRQDCKRSFCLRINAHEVDGIKQLPAMINTPDVEVLQVFCCQARQDRISTWFCRRAVSYSSRPRLRSQPPISTMASRFASWRAMII
jgi:hypothetical protein